MLPPQNRRTRKNRFATPTFIRALFTLAILSIGVVAIASLSVRSWASIERTSGKSASQRINHRISPGAAGVSAANVMVPRAPAPFAAITVDRTDDAAAASACTAAPTDCSLRGAVTFANSNPGTTIIVPAGTYNLSIPGGAGEGFSGNNSIGDLDVTATGTTISGAGAASTIIRQSQPGDRVIEINPFLDPGFIFSISDVMIFNGHETTAVGGGGMIAGSINNVTTVTNCIFSGNSATGGGTFGGGGISYTGGSLNLSGCSFTGNSTSGSGGGLGYSAGDPLGRFPSPGVLTVTNSSFTSNTAASSAAGGAAADLFDYNLGSGVYNFSGSSFLSNTATNGSGGAIVVESGGPLTVSTSSFAGNHAATFGGAISTNSSASVTFSRLVGNTVTLPANGLEIFTGAGTLNANDNWWGINTGPGPNDVRTPSGTVTILTWLQLENMASPNTICTGATSMLTADIKKRNAGPNLTVELNGLPPFPVPPMPVFNNAVLGTLSSVSTQFVNGSATATYTAGATPGSGSADATADNQVVTASIAVQANTATTPADQTVCQGATATFSTTASGPGPIHYAWTLDGSPYDGDNPSITVDTTTLSIGSHPVTVTVTGACSSTTKNATLIVQENTSATTPADQTVCKGATASFSTTASGAAPLHYAWTVDGSPFDGDNSSISVPTGSMTVGTHPVTVTVSGTCGSVTKSATLTVQASTTATTPADQTVCEGGSATFSTTAGGTGPFSYAWTVDGSPFGGNTSSITVSGASPGTHPVTVTVTGTCGSVTKNATLTVQASTTATTPADQTVCEGGSATFSTTAGGTGPFSYAWTVDGAPFGGNSSSITVSGASPGTHPVTVTVTGTCGSVTKSATLTVQASTTATTPADQTVCEGGIETFSTTAGGTGPFSYAWTVDGAPFGGNTSSITVSGASPGTHPVTVTVTGTCGSVTKSATLIVQASTTATTPADQTVCEGGSATFSTTAGGTGPFSYAWTVDGAPFGGNSSSITVSGASPGTHPVTVTVTGTCGSVTKSATLTVNANTATTDPADQTVCQGATANFSTTASGTGPFSYAWTVDGSAAGGNSPSLSVPTGSLSVGNHTIAVTVTGACGSASQSATLTVNANTATTDPPDQTVCQGATANFSTTASGTGPFTYAWTVDGTPAGNTSSISVPTGSLSVGNHTVAVTVTGACGSASQSATLTVQENTATSDPPDQTVCQGATASFSTTATGTGPFHYAWTLDGSPFDGDSSSINVPTGSLSVGNHTVAVTVTGGCGPASQSATLTVQANATTTDPPDQTVCQGATANFSTTASGTGPFHYAWTLDGSPYNGDSPSISVPTGSLTVGNHTVVVTTTGACGSVSQSATLSVNANTSTTDPPDQTVCKGATANFSTTASGTGPFHYAWTLDGSPFGGDTSSISVPTGSLTVGNHTVVVTTTGACGSASQSATLTVNANTATTDPPDRTVCQGLTTSFTTTASGTGPFSFVWKKGVTVLTTGSFGGRVTITNTATTSTLTITNVQAGDAGTYTVETTGACGTASQSSTLAVNSTPPGIVLNGTNIELWPPNHSYHTVTITSLVASASSCDGTVDLNSVVIDTVTSDEVENGNGDGNTTNDIVIACNRKSVQLRSERDGSGDGRVYTITFKVTDSFGVSSTATARVTVPKSQNGAAAVDSGVHYIVTNATCP
ncbi:MAG: C-terminal target protein [Acidobacteria bacterium]|nr:C-terminal target protein [Acidobacteriota bacterium]